MEITKQETIEILNLYINKGFTNSTKNKVVRRLASRNNIQKSKDIIVSVLGFNSFLDKFNLTKLYTVNGLYDIYLKALVYVVGEDKLTLSERTQLNKIKNIEGIESLYNILDGLNINNESLDPEIEGSVASCISYLHTKNSGRQLDNNLFDIEIVDEEFMKEGVDPELKDLFLYPSIIYDGNKLYSISNRINQYTENKNTSYLGKDIYNICSSLMLKDEVFSTYLDSIKEDRDLIVFFLNIFRLEIYSRKFGFMTIKEFLGDLINIGESFEVNNMTLIPSNKFIRVFIKDDFINVDYDWIENFLNVFEKEKNKNTIKPENIWEKVTQGIYVPNDGDYRNLIQSNFTK